MPGTKRLGMVGALAVGCMIATTAMAQDYRFVMVSHIGSNDPNMQWLTRSLDEFKKKYPNVETEYLSTNQYSIQEHVRLIEQALATQPDGIAVPIARAEEGEIPMPTKVLCANHDPAHTGLKARCRGMTDAMAEIDVEVEELFIGADPAQARNTMQSYLSSNEDVNYIFTVASWSAPWAWGVANDLGLSPDVDDEGITIITVDESPVALEGIKQGHVLSTNSQGFWLQGYVPMEWLYWNHEFGYEPQSNILTGPTVIDESNVDKYVELVRNVFGDAYDE